MDHLLDINPWINKTEIFNHSIKQFVSSVECTRTWGKNEPFSINLSRWYQSFKPYLTNPAIKPVRFPGVGNSLCNSKRRREPIENGFFFWGPFWAKKSLEPWNLLSWFRGIGALIRLRGSSKSAGNPVGLLVSSSLSRSSLINNSFKSSSP